MKPKRMGRQTQFAYAAAMMALKDAESNLASDSVSVPVAGYHRCQYQRDRCAGTRVFRQFKKMAPNGVPPTSSLNAIPQAAANTIADRLGSCAHAATTFFSLSFRAGCDLRPRRYDSCRRSRNRHRRRSDTSVTPLAYRVHCGRSQLIPEWRTRKGKSTFDLSRDSGVIVRRSMRRP